MMRTGILLLCLTGLSLFSHTAASNNLLMARSPLTFPETMLKLQDQLKKLGYTVSRVQRVDIGLSSSGYKTDKYRVVFFGKADEIKKMSQQYPQLLPYLPLKIAIFSEGEETLLVTSSPLQLANESQTGLKSTLKRWENDLRILFDQMRMED